MKVFYILILLLPLISCSTPSHSVKQTNDRVTTHVHRDSSAILMDKTIENTATIKIKAHSELTSTDNADVEINAFNGIALVTGETRNSRLRNQIIAIVRVIPNVRLVHDEMSVSLSESSRSSSNDAYLNEKVTTALQEINNLPDFDISMIKVVIKNSIVYLMGSIYQAEGYATAKKAQHVDGVIKIVTLFEYLD